MQTFREGLLEGRSVALCGAIPEHVKRLLRALGAGLHEVGPGCALHGASPEALICGEDDASLTRTWADVRAVAPAAFIPSKRGRIILLAPRDDARVVAAGLENLARTLSVEWARFGITTVAVVPGATATDEEIANLIAFLCSPAGAYYSGCRFDLA